MARPRVRKNSDAARRAASRQTRDEADECCASAGATSRSQVRTLYGSDEHTGVLPSGVFRARLCDEIRREAARRRAGRAAPRRSGLWRFRAPRCARRAVPRAQSRAPTRRCAAVQSGCETRAAAASAARRGATATTLVTTSVRSVPSSASTCAADMPYCTSSAAVCRSARALGRCRAALRAPSARCAAARRQTPARASRRRARRRAAARAPPTARRRARQCTARARRPAATRRHGDKAARRNAHLREAQQRLAVDAALQDRRDARAPRRAAPAEHVHQRRRQVERARLRTRVADRRRVHRVAEPLEVQRVGEPCDAARVNAIRDEAQRRRNLDAEVEPITAAEAEHTVLTQKRGQLLACRRALRRRPAARGRASPANSSTATTCAPRSSCSGAMRLARASRCAPQRVQPNERAAAYANRANSASKRPPDCDCKPPRPENISMPACIRAAKPVMSLIESPVATRSTAASSHSLARYCSSVKRDSSRQLRRGDKRNGAAREEHATRQRISIQRAPNPWRAVKVERRLVAVVARVGRHARGVRTHFIVAGRHKLGAGRQMSLEVQQQPRGRQPPDHAQLPQRTDGAARKVRHDARALLRRDRAGARQRVHHQHDRRQHAVAPVRVGRLRHGQTLVDRRAEIGVADARVRAQVVKCRERRKERAETRLRLKLGAVRAKHRHAAAGVAWAA
jgi:hypothetical protein